MKLFVTRALPGNPLETLAKYYEVRVSRETRPLSQEELKQALLGCEVAICTLTDPIHQGTVPPSLKLLMTFSVGLDHIDTAYLQSQGILLSHTPVVLTDATADLAWALILCCNRRIDAGIAFMRAKRFTGFDPTLLLGETLRGKVLGIVGLGRIGRAVADRGVGFGMQVIYCSRNEVEDCHYERVGLKEILERSDVLSVHCPLTEQTRGMLGAGELRRMKPTAILINTARGAIVDESALVSHLSNHPNFVCGLDVYEREPEVCAGLVELPNAVCLPHLGSATRQARMAMAQTCVDEVLRYARGEKLKHLVTK